MPPDAGEADKIFRAVERLGLKYAVITSVTRDDLEDGGAAHFASVVTRLRDMAVKIGIEVLVPDFKASPDSIKTVHKAGVDVFAHNIDTVRRVHRSVKPRADYDISLSVLRISKAISPDIPTKSGIMLGLGETEEDILGSMKDLRQAGCDILTLGQYLKPAGGKIAESEFVSPNLFAKYKEMAYNLGFTRVSAGPFVRSSYYAACLNNI
jgi:lipoic acid synthetase